MSLGRERLAWRLDARAGWRRGPRDDRVSAGAALRLRGVPGAGRPLADEHGAFGGLADATGMTIAADGTVYVLDARTPALYRFDPCAGWDRLPCVAGLGSGPGEVSEPNGIALAPWGDLYVADTGNRRVQILTVRGWRVREVIGPFELGPQGEAWEPFDVVVTPRGQVVASDRANGLLAVLDRRGRLVATYDGAGAGFPPLRRPTHLAADARGRLYVVQDGDDAVTVLGPDGRPLERVERHDGVEQRFCPGPVGVDGDGNVVVADTASGRLYVFGAPAERPGWRPQVSCQPCGLDAVAVGPGGRAVVAGGGAGPRVEELDLTARLELEGTFTSSALDSTMYRCRWHRVVVQADVPEGAYLTVRTLTSEAPKSDDEVADLPDDRWSEAVLHEQRGGGAWDCLVRSPEGRFLWLRLGFEGTGTATPEVRSVVVSYPRQTSTDYLPGVYRRQPGGEDFLERFLAIFDRTFADLAAEVDDLARYADPHATPAGEDGGADFLSWLASWVGLSLDRHWPVGRRRQLVAEAAWLFAHRGTVAGLRRHLEIYLGYAPRILEHYRLRDWLHAGEGRLGDCSRLWGEQIVNRLRLDVHAELGRVQLVDTHDPLRDPFWVHAHTFTVFVPGDAGDDTRRHALERIIALAKPAHTRAVLRVVEPRMRVGTAMVGLDTVVGAYPERTVLGAQPAADEASRLGHDSVLGTDPDPYQPPGLQIGTRRIGADTLID